MDELLDRMPMAPHGQVALSMNAEWHFRSPEEDDCWTQHCQKTRDFLGEKMVLLGKTGVTNARIMAEQAESPTPDSMTCRIYHEIGDMVGTHDAAFNAMTRLPVHMRARETPAHLLIAATLLALINNDFSHLRAKEGTYWSDLCHAVSQYCRCMVRLDDGHTTDASPD